MPCIITQRKTEQSQFEYCELKHRRRRMLHFIAYMFSSRFTRVSLRPAASSLSLSPAHTHTQPNLLATPPAFCNVWMVGHCTIMPLSHFWHSYAVILLFLLHRDAFSSSISKHWKQICGLDQNHATGLKKSRGGKKNIYIYILIYINTHIYIFIYIFIHTHIPLAPKL